MRKTLWVLLGIVAAVLLWSIVKYNSFIKKEETIDNAWSQVENVYQRRMDLIPSLIAIVQSYTDYEQQTLIETVEARAQQASALTVNPETASDGQLTGFDQAQQQLGIAVNDVIVSIENYPDLKAAESYQTFLAQYAGCENRIFVERGRYNQAALDYNSAIRRFPGNIIANQFGFEKRPYFESDTQN